MSLKHTPGPWKAVPNPVRPDGWFVVRDVPAQPYKGRDMYGKIRMMMPPAVIKCQLEPADAVLVAASPDLLNFVKQVVEYYSDCEADQEGTGGLGSLEKVFLIEGRQLISQAECTLTQKDLDRAIEQMRLNGNFLTEPPIETTQFGVIKPCEPPPYFEPNPPRSEP